MWAGFFWIWFRDTPKEKRGVNAAGLQLIEQGRENSTKQGAPFPWKRLATSATLWALCLQYFCVSYGWMFYITWRDFSSPS